MTLSGDFVYIQKMLVCYRQIKRTYCTLSIPLSLDLLAGVKTMNFKDTKKENVNVLKLVTSKFKLFNMIPSNDDEEIDYKQTNEIDLVRKLESNETVQCLLNEIKETQLNGSRIWNKIEISIKNKSYINYILYELKDHKVKGTNCDDVNPSFVRRYFCRNLRSKQKPCKKWFYSAEDRDACNH